MASTGEKGRNLFFILKRTVVDIYNHLGYSMLISILWCLVFIPFAHTIVRALLSALETQDHPLSLLLFLLVIGVPYAAFILGPVQTALYYQMNQVINDEAELKGLWKVSKHYWLAARFMRSTRHPFFAWLIYSSVFVLDPFFLRSWVLFCFIFFLLVFAILYLPGFLVFQRNTVKKVMKKNRFCF